MTAVPGPASLALHARRAAVVPTGVSSALPVYIARAHGAIVVDVDGNQFIDMGAGIGV
ncbi:MAG: 4-aminobutyrate--2-oxoglutarate transaminase, partial [Microbacteriaceae bacterium]